MKKLLYVAALAVLSTACSVDNIQDENSTILNETRDVEGLDSCLDAYLLNTKGVKRGHLQTFVDQDQNTITVRIITYNNWKNRENKIVIGTLEDINSGQESIFTKGEFEYSESFNNGIYISDYTFDLNDVHSDFAIMTVSNISLGKNVETVWSTDGIEIPDGYGNFYLENFTENCY